MATTLVPTLAQPFGSYRTQLHVAADADIDDAALELVSVELAESRSVTSQIAFTVPTSIEDGTR
jgi:hypothetical protein